MIIQLNCLLASEIDVALAELVYFSSLGWGFRLQSLSEGPAYGLDPLFLALPAPPRLLGFTVFAVSCSELFGSPKA